MFRQVSTVALVVLAVFGSLAVATAEEPKEAGGKKQITNSLGSVFIYCPAGSFKMGSPADEKDRFADRETQVSVTISKGFYLGKTSVTQAEFKTVMRTSPWSAQAPCEGGRRLPGDARRLERRDRVLPQADSPRIAGRQAAAGLFLRLADRGSAGVCLSGRDDDGIFVWQ